MLKEDFNEENKNWNYQTTYENFFVAEKGDFYLNRINKQNPYAILTNWTNELSKFQIRSALKLAPEQGKDQSVGVIFLVQGDGKGAVVLEINREKEYRIKQLVGQFYKFLSGDKESQGWVKSPIISNKEDYNELDVRVYEGQMDFYINKKFLNSFNVDEYKYGGLGLIIGPNTKARVDYFNIYSIEAAADSLQNINGDFTNNLKGDELIAKLNSDIDQLKLNLDDAQKKLANSNKEKEIELSRMKALLDKYLKKNDSLENKAQSLGYLEDEMLQGINQDVVIALSAELKEQIKRNYKLDEELGLIKDSLFLTHKKYQDLKLILLKQVIDKRTADLKVKDAANAKLTKQEILKINEERAKFVKDSIDKAKKLKADPKLKASQVLKTDKSNSTSKKEDADKKPESQKQETKDKTNGIKDNQAETTPSPLENDLIKPNPRPKKPQELILTDSLGVAPKPIKSKVKRAEKVNRN